MISNGMSSTSGNAAVGQQVTFSCSAGFLLNGTATVMCQNDGTFLPSPPSCIQSKSFTLNVCFK